MPPLWEENITKTYNMNKINDKIITFIPWEEIDPEAQEQIKNTSNLPFLFHHVAIMPDCHYGKGATVGTVIATEGAVVPAAIGVDIGCGMIAVKTNLKKSDIPDLKKIREGIERRIPMSMGRFNSNIQESAKEKLGVLKGMDGAETATALSPNWPEQMGTLGGGNHFIEICEDEEGTIWVTLHSGSRGVGNKIGNHYIKIAQKLMEQFKIELSDPDLAYLPEGTKEFNDYLRDLHWAQEFARLNRDEMMDRVLTELRYAVHGNNNAIIELERINCHHNFTQIEQHFGKNVWITRKGAVQAKLDMKGMIPGSMGTRSYIFSGLENPMSFHSSPHGAGRKMSRTKAQKAFTMDDLEKSMEGIEYRKSDVLIDEIPGAYKDIDQVMEYAKELVKIEHTLKQILNCKGD